MSNGQPGQPEIITLGSSKGAIQVEAVDLAKVRRKFARLDRLKEVGLEAEDIATLSAPHLAAEGTGNANEDAAAILARTCPSSCVLFFSLPAPCAICPFARLEWSTRQSRKRVRRGRHSTLPCTCTNIPHFRNATDSHILLVPCTTCFLLRTDPSLSCWWYTADEPSSGLSPICTTFQSAQTFYVQTFPPKRLIVSTPTRLLTGRFTKARSV